VSCPKNGCLGPEEDFGAGQGSLSCQSFSLKSSAKERTDQHHQGERLRRGVVMSNASGVDQELL